MPPSLLDFIFPKKSLRGHEGAFITEAEIEQLVSHPQIFQKEDLRKRGMGALDIIRVASTYSDCPLLRKAIWTFKYSKVPGLGEVLADLLVPLIPTSYQPTCLLAYLPNLPTSLPAYLPTILCPVPLYFLRRFNRGFNQAQLLAFIVSQKTGIQMRELLIRTRWTGRQTGRNREERLQALKGAFRVRLPPEAKPQEAGGRRGLASPPLGFDLKHTRIILLDDIMTTGATLQECARTLREAGARQVEGLVVAHG